MRKLDAMVERYIFGLEERPHKYNSASTEWFNPKLIGYNESFVKHAPSPYNTNIEPAWRVHQEACSWIFSKRRAYLQALNDIIQERCRDDEPPAPPCFEVAWPDALMLIEVGDFSLAALRAVGVSEEEIEAAIESDTEETWIKGVTRDRDKYLAASRKLDAIIADGEATVGDVGGEASE